MQNNSHNFDTVEYISSMAQDLKIMASATDSKMLVYLLDMVIAEANAIQDNTIKTANFMNSKF